jgi:histidine triad (HIT) family protein
LIRKNMYSHEPKNYICPMCLVVEGIENEHNKTKGADVFYRDDKITAFVSTHWWPNNPGNILIITNDHIENIYDLTSELSDHIHRFEKKVALAIKEVYKCDGISSRQHNEPAGNQEIWHYHLHVFPRYKDDRLYECHKEKRFTNPQERTAYAEKLKQYLADNL